MSEARQSWHNSRIRAAGHALMAAMASGEASLYRNLAARIGRRHAVSGENHYFHCRHLDANFAHLLASRHIAGDAIIINNIIVSPAQQAGS